MTNIFLDFASRHLAHPKLDRDIQAAQQNDSEKSNGDKTDFVLYLFWKPFRGIIMAVLYMVFW